MSFTLGSVTVQAPDAVQSGTPVAEEEEFYSSWSLFLVCLLLILSLWTSYYLQLKRIRAIHETLVAIFAGMFVGLVVRLAPGTMIREMLVSRPPLSISGRGCGLAISFGSPTSSSCIRRGAFSISRSHSLES